GVVGGEQAEVHAERQHQLDQLGAGLAQLQDRAPQHVRQHQAHEVQVLRELHHELGQETGLALLDHKIGEQRGGREQEAGAEDDVLLRAQLAEDVHEQADQRQVQGDGQERVRIVVEVKVFLGGEAVVEQDPETQKVSDRGGCHI